MIDFKLYRTLPLAIEQALLGGDQSRALVGNDPSDFLADANMEGGETKPLRLALDLVIHWCERVPTCLLESMHLR